MSIKIFKSLIIFVSLLSISSGCSSISELSGPKNKNNSEEFLVEKKPPLSMPPNFNELPLPKNENLNENDIEEKNIKEIIDNQNKNLENNNKNEQSLKDLDVTINNDETIGNLEKSIIEKIKNN